jgi:hypothetical protein
VKATTAVMRHLSVRLAVVGAAVVGAAAVLPLDEPMVAAAGVVGEQLPIEHGAWILVVGALGIAGSALWVSRGHRDGWPLPVCLCVLTSLPIVVGAAGAVTTAPGAVDPVGVAHYVAAAGVAVALVGSLMLSRSSARGGAPNRSTTPASGTGTCPSCRRSVRTEDRTCTYCGFALRRYRSGF